MTGCGIHAQPSAMNVRYLHEAKPVVEVHKKRGQIPA